MQSTLTWLTYSFFLASHTGVVQIMGCVGHRAAGRGPDQYWFCGSAEAAKCDFGPEYEHFDLCMERD